MKGLLVDILVLSALSIAQLLTRYYWYKMREDVALWYHTCTSCASKARPSKTPQVPMGTVRVGAPVERVALDIMGRLNETERIPLEFLC